MDYILKHKNIPVVLFSMDEEFQLKGEVEIVNPDHVPFGKKFLHDKTSIIVELKNWIENRGIPESRSDRFDIYKHHNVDNSKALMLGSYALNLSDHYMIHRTDTEIVWEKINCFDNMFSSKDHKTSKNANPNASVNGALPKEWFIDTNNIRMLDKYGRKSTFQQEPFNEVIATKIMHIFNIEGVPYSLERKEGNVPVSRCRCMVDRNTEIIPAAMVLNMEERKGRNNYDLFIEICEKNAVKDAKEYIDKMIFIDYLIGNDDRHLYNFGIIRDANTLGWLKGVPLFDSGNSLYYNKNDIHEITKESEIACRWFPKTNFSKLTLIDYPHWYKNAQRSLVRDIIDKGLSYNEYLPVEKKKIIGKIVEERLNIFENEIAKKEKSTRN